MKSIVRCAIIAFALVAGSGAVQAMDTAAYKGMAEETIREVLSGKFSDIDKTLARQEKLIALGVAEAQEFAAKAPEHAKLMQLTVSNVDAMKKMSPEELEEQWGDGGKAFQAAGFDLDKLNQFGAVRSHTDVIIHPATTYVLFSQYKKTGDKVLLDQAKSELTEVLEHLQHLQ